MIHSKSVQMLRPTPQKRARRSKLKFPHKNVPIRRKIQKHYPSTKDFHGQEKADEFCIKQTMETTSPIPQVSNIHEESDLKQEGDITSLMDQLKSIRESAQKVDLTYEYPDDFSITSSVVFTDKSKLIQTMNQEEVMYKKQDSPHLKVVLKKVEKGASENNRYGDDTRDREED